MLDAYYEVLGTLDACYKSPRDRRTVRSTRVTTSGTHVRWMT
jgi:hypothetical protein